MKVTGNVKPGFLDHLRELAEQNRADNRATSLRAAELDLLLDIVSAAILWRDTDYGSPSELAVDAALGDAILALESASWE